MDWVDKELERLKSRGIKLAEHFECNLPDNLTYTEFLWALDGLGIELDFVTSNEMYDHYCKIKGA